MRPDDEIDMPPAGQNDLKPAQSFRYSSYSPDVGPKKIERLGDMRQVGMEVSGNLAKADEVHHACFLCCFTSCSCAASLGQGSKDTKTVSNQ